MQQKVCQQTGSKRGGSARLPRWQLVSGVLGLNSWVSLVVCGLIGQAVHQADRCSVSGKQSGTDMSSLLGHLSAPLSVSCWPTSVQTTSTHGPTLLVISLLCVYSLKETTSKLFQSRDSILWVTFQLLFSFLFFFFWPRMYLKNNLFTSNKVSQISLSPSHCNAHHIGIKSMIPSVLHGTVAHSDTNTNPVLWKMGDTVSQFDEQNNSLVIHNWGCQFQVATVSLARC